MQLFYCPQILSHEYYLLDEEARHCYKVLRKKQGDIINITDGKGSFYDGKLTSLSPQKCEFEITNTRSIQKVDHHIHIAIAPTKNIDRTEWFVEKCVELGIDEISFLQTSFSERKKINTERIRKKAISALKQSMRAYLPKINELKKLGDFLNSPSHSQNFVAHLEENTPYLHKIVNKSDRYTVLIGPEGGFSKEEISGIKSKGYHLVKLGDHRLRTETAGVVACSVLNMINLP